MFETFPLVDRHGDVEQLPARLLVGEDVDIIKLMIEREGEWRTIAAARCTPGATKRACAMWRNPLYRNQAQREARALANDLLCAQRHATDPDKLPLVERSQDFASVYFPVAYVNGELTTNHYTIL